MAYHKQKLFPCVLTKRVIIYNRIPKLPNTRHPFASFATSSHGSDFFAHTCAVDAEPLHRYKKGGYHPTGLGDLLKDGRYKILHKLGWGGYSTVWAARDRRDDIYVALKICTAELENGREMQVMKKIASIHPSPRHLMRMFDNFDLEGPNGVHKCFVLELLGPSVPDMAERYSDYRLPGGIAKTIAKQALSGLDTLHRQKIAHGDLHTNNLAFTLPDLNRVSEGEFIEMLGKPNIEYVQRKDNKPLEPSVPEYIVRPASDQKLPSPSLLSNAIKIIDFGQSFLSTAIPHTLRTPVSVRGPEVIFKDNLDYRVDLWSMGCIIFELFVGQPPFTSIMATPSSVAGEIQEMISDTLPERWQNEWNAMKGTASCGTGVTLQAWLEETYFDEDKKQDFTTQDIKMLGGIVARTLRFEPSTRTSARDILNDP